MGVKDQALLEYLEDGERFADLMNGTMFRGKQVIDPQFLKKEQRKKRLLLKVLQQENTKEKDSDENVHRIEKNDTVSLGFMERERDALRLYDKPGGKCLLGCEGQIQADYTMPVRNLGYDGIEYGGQISSQEYSTKEENGKTYPLIPVFNEVLYLGEKRWKNKHTLQEMMKIPENMEEFTDLLPDYRVYVVDIHEQNPELFCTEWKAVFQLMKHSRKKKDLKAYMENHMEELQRLSMETRCFLSVLLDQYELVENEKVEVKDMCKAWDGAMLMYRDEGRKLGRREGKREGRREGYIELIKDGILPVKEAAKRLNMKEEELKKYL